MQAVSCPFFSIWIVRELFSEKYILASESLVSFSLLPYHSVCKKLTYKQFISRDSFSSTSNSCCKSTHDFVIERFSHVLGWIVLKLDLLLYLGVRSSFAYILWLRKRFYERSACLPFLCLKSVSSPLFILGGSAHNN